MYKLDLGDKVAVVMGVANKRSLGWAIAQELHRAGAKMAFTYVGEKFGANVEKLAGDEGIEGARFYDCDVSDDAAVDRAFEAIGKDFGHVDMLVHSIAFAKREEIADQFLSTSRDGFRVALDVSAYSFLRVAQAVVPLMEGREGAMIGLSYLGADRAIPRYNVMGTAKAALEQIVRQLAFELGPKNIRVNALSAGPMNTLSARGLRDLSDMLKHHAEKAPLKRNVTPEDVGRSGLYLLSELSSGVTGETLYVDAGYNIMGF